MHYNFTNVTNGTIADGKVTQPNFGILIFSLIICLMISTWTIVVNGIVILCFYLNRKELWVKRSKGLLFLVITDVCVGVSFFILITVQMSDNIPFIGCFLPCGLFICLQLFESLQILRICIHRLTVTRKIAQRVQNIKCSRVLPQIVLLLLLSMLVGLVFLIWITTNSPLGYCSLEQMFGSNMYSACIFFLFVLAGPNTITSIIYIGIICQLRKSTRTIKPLPSTSSITQSHNPVRTNVQNPFAQIFHTENQTKVNIGMHVIKATGNTVNVHNNFSKSDLKKALRTIGLILVLSNISMIPYVCILTYQIVYPNFGIPEYLWKLCPIFLHCNSALSPFVYVMTVNKIKQALNKMLRRLNICRYTRNNAQIN